MVTEEIYYLRESHNCPRTFDTYFSLKYLANNDMSTICRRGPADQPTDGAPHRVGHVVRLGARRAYLHSGNCKMQKLIILDQWSLVYSINRL